METVKPVHDGHLVLTGVDADETIPHVVSQHAVQRPDAPAIVAVGRLSLTYGALWNHVRAMDEQLRGWGIGRGDRVALLLPTGPEMAVALLGVLTTAVATALNPDSGPTDITSELQALRVTCIIVPAGVESPAITESRRLHLRVITLTPLSEDAAGLFTLTGEEWGAARATEAISMDDVAFVSRTSGTTSQPKVVPLTHRNLFHRYMVGNQNERFTSDDRVLILRPIYYGAGQSAWFTALVTGGSAICAATSSPKEFFTCLDTCRPTICSAVPTTYQAILTQAPDHATSLERHSLRLLRTSGSAMPTQLQAELENLFHVPVFTRYGSTDGGFIAQSPLPPQRRKPGAAGVIDSQDVAVMDGQGALLPTGQIGEIVTRGPGVISGYEDDPDANQEVFIDGWFRTGDAGYLDDEGYLFLTGRFKEMINRGGEKVRPSEVEDVLLEHPAVAEAVVFALPHTTLGEDVGAAVVLRQGMQATERELRVLVGDQLTAFKVPRRIVFLDTLPVSAAGKVQRIGMAARLGLDRVEAPTYVAPHTYIERRLAELWAPLLGVRQVGLRDNFFDLGGNSLQAVQLFDQIAEVFGQRLSVGVLIEESTIEYVAGLLTQGVRGEGNRLIVPLRTQGSHPPLFCVQPPIGTLLDYRYLVQALEGEQPVYGVVVEEPEGALGSLEELAAGYVRALREVQPRGPYYLAGYSGAGVIAYEMAQQLLGQGEGIGLLVLLDAIYLDPEEAVWRGRARRLAEQMRRHTGVLMQLPMGEKAPYAVGRLRGLGRQLRQRGRIDQASVPPEAAVREKGRWARDLTRRYVPRAYAGRAVHIWAEDNPLKELGARDPRERWAALVRWGLEVHRVRGDHYTMIWEPAYTRQVAAVVQECLHRAQGQHHPHEQLAVKNT